MPRLSWSCQSVERLPFEAILADRAFQDYIGPMKEILYRKLSIRLGWALLIVSVIFASLLARSFYNTSQEFDPTISKSHIALILALQKHRTQFGVYPDRLAELERSSSTEELRTTRYKEYDDSGETCIYPCYQKEGDIFRLIEAWVPPGNCVLEFGKSNRFECTD